MSQFDPSPTDPKSPVDDVWLEERGDNALNSDRKSGGDRKVEKQELQGLGDAKLHDHIVQHSDV